MTDIIDPRYKDIIITEEYNPERFWEYGKWAYRLADGVEQFDRLISYGLKPYHYLLDVGCGWLRGGINLIEYLDIGYYYGFDKEQDQLDRGEMLLKGKDLIHKKPVIKLVTNTKGIWHFIGRMKFDYMMAYSVFTHTDPYMTTRLFTNTIPFLKDKGKFFATFHGRDESSDIFVGDKHLSRSDEYKAVRYPFSFFEGLAHKNKMTVKHLSSREEDAHGQDWMVFSRK